MAYTDKILSGRWILTIISGIAMLLMVLADVIVIIKNPAVTNLPFSPEALFAIISSVTAFYFLKPTDTTNNKPLSNVP